MAIIIGISFTESNSWFICDRVPHQLPRNSNAEEVFDLDLALAYASVLIMYSLQLFKICIKFSLLSEAQALYFQIYVLHKK